MKTTDSLAKAAFAALYPKISPLYGEFGRVYHDIRHVKELVYQFSRLQIHMSPEYLEKIGSDDMTVWLVAALGHDAYYDPMLGSPINEQLSLGITVDAIQIANLEHIIGDDTLVKICQCIEASADHLTFREHLPFTTKVFLDMDMIGFANPDYGKYTQNSNKVMTEYEWAGFNAKEIRAGRLSFLTNLLDSRKGQFYYTLKPEYSDRAFQNIRKEIEEIKLEFYL